MRRYALQISRLATAMFLKGAVMLALGGAALIWSEDFLINAMVLTSLLLAMTGLYEVVLALRARTELRGWEVPLADGAASLGLAALTVALTAVSLHSMLLLTALWLVLYASFAGGLALALWPMSRTRTALLVWAAIDFSLAALAVFDTQVTIFTLLYVGAVYAIAFGAFQVGVGVWLRRIAAPRFAPTIQASWRTTRPT